MKKDGMLIGGIVALLFLVSTTHADILHVPGDYPTIQAALVFALTGDTVLVDPGTYYEHIVWPATQGIYLVSEYGADSTIIDAVGSLPVITIETDVDSTTVIQGFTIVNGGAEYGGGIYCVGASPTISHNTIMNNSSGGIFCNDGSPIISQNIITNNVSGGGGGITCWFSPSSKIIDNIIENNSGGEGGGISAIVSCPEITGNTVNSNSAVCGGGMYFFKSTPIINYNTVSNNDAEYGDGLYFYQSGGDINYNNIFWNGWGMCRMDPGQLNAEYNWWGDSTGPYHPDSNPGGLGDTVSDYVDFDPWLFEPWGIEEHEPSQPIANILRMSPNPFRDRVNIKFSIKYSAEVTELKIYDATGRLIKSFSHVTNQIFDQVVWDGRDDAGKKLPSGVYFLKLVTGDYSATEKLLLIR